MTFGSPLNALAAPLALTRQFDAVSNRIGLDYPSGQVLSYNFSPDDRFTQLVSTANAGGYPGDPGAPANRLVLQKQRWGELAVATQLGNGVTIASTYDAAGRRIADDCSLVKGQDFLLQQLWDGAGNRILDIERYAGTVNGWWHGYDSTNRLVDSVSLPKPQAVVTGPLAPPNAPVPVAGLQCQKAVDAIVSAYGVNPPALPDFGYDATGNFTSQRVAGGSLVYSANMRNEYVSVGNTSFSYDRAGRLIDDTKYSFAYNFRGQLVQAASQPNGKIALQVFHDATGRPVGIVDGARTCTLVLDDAALIESYDDGILSAVHLWEDQDRLCFFAVGGKDQYVSRDVLGSTRLTSDSQGAAIGVFRYDPFGNLLAVAPANPFLYAGKYLYNSIGWYEYGARHYIPSIGRFAQPDPAGFGDGANLYTFVGNNPLSATDPSGTGGKKVVGRAAVTDSSDTAAISLEERMALWGDQYTKALTGTRGEARQRVHDYYKQQLHLLTHEAIHAGHIATLKFAAVTYAAASAGKLGGIAGEAVGTGVAAEIGLGTLGTNLLAHGLSGVTGAASTEATYLAFGKPKASGGALVVGGVLGVAGGLAETSAQYYTFPRISAYMRGKPGLIGPGKYGWQFGIEEGGGPIGPAIGSKQDPNIPSTSDFHRAHYHGYFIGGNNQAFYASPRVNTSYMKVFEYAARRFAPGGFLEVTTMRGGGVTSLEWSAYTAGGQPMRLGIPDVLDPSLPNLRPMLRGQHVSITPGTAIWVEQ